jgi:integrase
VGIIGARFAAGMWIYSRARVLEHDNRHTLVTELAESGAGDEVIMSIAGHVSRASLFSRYSHVQMEAKRRTLDKIAARQRAADEKRKKAEKQQQQGLVVAQSSGDSVIAR